MKELKENNKNDSKIIIFIETVYIKQLRDNVTLIYNDKLMI